MKKRRASRLKDRLFIEEDSKCSVTEGNLLRVGYVSSKTKRRSRKKTLKQLEQIQFLNTCSEYLVSRPQQSFKVLPDILPHSCSNAELLDFLSTFINRYIDVFDLKHLRPTLSQFYDPSAYLTFQIAPYVCQSSLEKCSDKSYRPKYQPLWGVYERFAVNSLPGAFPLPSWAWCAVKEESMPRRLRSPSLPKQDRKLLKSLKAYQMGHIQRLASVTRSASCAPDRSLTSIPPPPIARTECRGRDQILGLLCRLPGLLHVKNDKYSHLDVIWSKFPLVCLRYSCVAAEPVQHDTLSDLRNVSDQLLDITPYGSYVVRLVSRMLVLHQSGKIFQEDWCITPLPSSYVEECSLIITEAVSNFMTPKALFAPVSTFEAGIQAEVACSKLVEELSSATGMNKSYSLQCLTECQFNLDSALHSFQKVQEAGLLPAEAFSPD
ncbi:hypothetical protein MN116_004180 [Schistosoma mekongi]|uniref:TAP-C domain-containing protein n=1 Tax=Schistosoma mekongi TaxID=38744 RepID=A0AAE1ZFN9_SCHME|nr:hypothetical protein MN116_004180 [Schistosoma mekongi]